MKIVLQRHYLDRAYTLGALFVNDEPLGYTLEDPVREIESGGRWIWTHTMKVPGKTAIPSGQYEVVVNWSARFSRPLPLLLRVPDFEGVRIHGGNTVQDTEGCPLLGAQQSEDGRVWDCAEVNARLVRMIQQTMPTQKVSIVVRNP